MFNDKEFLLKLAESLDRAGFDEFGCTKVSRELAEQVSLKLKEIVSRMND